jgi:hypothetical protein
MLPRKMDRYVQTYVPGRIGFIDTRVETGLAGLDQNPFNCRRVRRTGDPMSLETAPPTWGMRARDR